MGASGSGDPGLWGVWGLHCDLPDLCLHCIYKIQPHVQFYHSFKNEGGKGFFGFFSEVPANNVLFDLISLEVVEMQ